MVLVEQTETNEEAKIKGLIKWTNSEKLKTLPTVGDAKIYFRINRESQRNPRSRDRRNFHFREW